MAPTRLVALSMDRDEHDNSDENNQDHETKTIPLPLDDRVLQVVLSSQKIRRDDSYFYCIRPARLAAELGLSVEDACAELCGLLAAVGNDNGARFEFEKSAESNNPGNNGIVVMVFYFPHDVAARARKRRRVETIRDVARRLSYIAIRLVQVITAFGLILSLLILCIAAVTGLVAAIVALSRSGTGGRNETQRLMHQVRSLFYTMRQLLWCFALFGPDHQDATGNGGETSFYREIAYDVSLCFSVCCGNPMSVFYWLRVNQLSRRRARAFRGWGGRSVASVNSNNVDVYGVEGVSLIRRGDWDQGESRTVAERGSSPSSEVSAEYRGLLSVAVEFLFGQSPFQPGPTQAERWQMRAAFLIKVLSKHSSVTLTRLCPYADDPPINLEDTARITEQGLLVVAHFNGVPIQALASVTTLMEATFAFPELLAESEVSMRQQAFSFEDDDAVLDWKFILYKQDVPRRPLVTEVPSYLKESLYRLTSLPANLFWQCFSLGTLNLVGVMMLGPSLGPGGMLQLDDTSDLGRFVKGFVMPVLRFYAILFLVLPVARFLLILVLNARRRGRNERRRRLAHELADE